MKKKNKIDEELDIELGTDSEVDEDESERIEGEETETTEEEVDTRYDEMDDAEDDEVEEKKKGKGILGLLLMFGWLVLVLLLVIFYFYFLKDLPFLNKDDTETTEEIEEGYEVNANEAINALVQEYFFALEECNQEKLMALVIDFSAFNDMSRYERVASVMGNYHNFTVYTLPGYYGSDTLVYVTCNFDIGGVDTKGLNINQFYVVNTTEGYKIDNTVLDEPVANYISEQSGREDIQALYKSVYDYIEESAEKDPAFKKFAEDYGILQ